MFGFNRFKKSRRFIRLKSQIIWKNVKEIVHKQYKMSDSESDDQGQFETAKKMKPSKNN